MFIFSSLEGEVGLRFLGRSGPLTDLRFIDLKLALSVTFLTHGYWMIP
jgi:hypothetical protein